MSDWHDTKAWRDARAMARKILEPVCTLCHADLVGADFTIDHIVPPSQTGGKPNHDLSNLQALCRSCNGRKQDRYLVRTTWINPRWTA